MGNENDTNVMAVFCDFENIALGVKEADYDRFDIAKILERLLIKGNIVVKKAYSDWQRYKDYKPLMHEASFELIEIPHVRISGKNSADIRMVVDALDLCYTKEHVDTFVIVSGDSDFSPLVSKLRENNKMVIGVGVKNSTSDLLIANCDEFIYYDDLVKSRKSRRKSAATKSSRKTKSDVATKTPKTDAEKEQELWDLIVGTFDGMMGDKGEVGRIRGSMIKQAIKRRNPGFSESYYGFKNFGDLLVQAHKKGLLDVELEEKSGDYIIWGSSSR